MSPIWRLWSGILIAVLFFIGSVCVLVDKIQQRQYAQTPVLRDGFHFPDAEPDYSISECKPPYCVFLMRVDARWRWVVIKHGNTDNPLGGGITESYRLSRNTSLACVDEDKKAHASPR